jgi:hypothetical protein
MRHIALLVILATAGCTALADRRTPVAVSYLEYTQLSCMQLEQDMVRLDTAMSTASASDQKNSGTIDIYAGQERSLRDALSSKNCDGPVRAEALIE